MHERRARSQSTLGIRHRGQGCVLDLDQLDRVASERRALGDDGRHGHPGGMDDVVREVLVREGVQPGDGRHVGRGAQRAEILGRDDPNHSRRLLRLIGPNGGYPGVSMRASEKGQVRAPGKPEVLDVLPLAGDQPRIFHPLERPTDVWLLAGLRHASLL